MSIKTNLRICIGLVWIMGTTLVNAQDNNQFIDLATVLELGGANNLTIKEYQLKQDLILADIAKAKEWWLPDFYAGTTIHQLWGNAMNGNGAFFNDVNRQNFWAGLGLNASWDFADGIFTKNAVTLKAEAAVYETEAKKNNALLIIIETYYDFLSAQLTYFAYDELVAQAENINKQIKVQVEAGLQYESEWLLAESNIYQLKVDQLNAYNSWTTKSAELTGLLNLDPSKNIISKEELLAPIALITFTGVPFIYDSVYAKCPELKQLDALMAATEEEKKMVTKGLLIPELRLGTDGAYFGDVFSPIDPTFEINAALVWKIPLGQLVYHGQEQQYNTTLAIQTNQIKQTKAKIHTNVIRLSTDIVTRRNQYEFAQQGSELAKKAMSQSIARQKIGTARPLEIIQAQELYIQSVLNYLTAVAKYNTVQYRYHVAIGNSL